MTDPTEASDDQLIEVIAEMFERSIDLGELGHETLQHRLVLFAAVLEREGGIDRARFAELVWSATSRFADARAHTLASAVLTQLAS